MGPLQLPATHLYVSLRCMQLLADGYWLYAGGGLLPDSTEEQEWQETEAKMETMRSLLVHNS
jgi:isochorismate synthase